MKIIGVTGGIGSGKSMVCDVFATLGIPVFEADEQAKKIYEDYPQLLDTLRDLFGDAIMHNGHLNKPALAKIVFNNEAELLKLNALVHPLVKDQFHQWIRQQNAPYIIREAAILIESGAYAGCDRIILVTAPADLRIKRVMKRSGLSAEEISARISKQMNDEEKSKYADYIIQNDDTQLIVPKVLMIHNELISGHAGGKGD